MLERDAGCGDKALGPTSAPQPLDSPRTYDRCGSPKPLASFAVHATIHHACANGLGLSLAHAHTCVCYKLITCLSN